MSIDQNKSQNMPDVAMNQPSSYDCNLDWVGMDNIVVPFQFDSQTVSARVGVYVDLDDPKAKGIHMSRLYLVLKETLSQRELTVDVLKNLLRQCVQSQKGLSKKAKIEITWDHVLKREALLSPNEGWKSYPVKIKASELHGQFSWSLDFSVLYSSTCPCSAALSRQLRQRAFQKQFENRELNLTEISQWLGDNQVSSPHSQRSRADIFMVLNHEAGPIPLELWVGRVESRLKTAVQTAVKREDEQEFARLNGENMMFVEDALRTLHGLFVGHDEVSQFTVRATHLESLHAHDAAGVTRFRRHNNDSTSPSSNL